MGDGPGEMRAARRLDRLEGDILQVTHTAGRLRYGPEGELIQDDRLDWNRIHDVGRRASLDGSAGFLMESCDIPTPLFLDDSVLLCGSSYTDVRFMPEEAGLHQSHSMVVRTGCELDAVDTLEIFETRSLVMYQDGGMLRSWFLGPAWRPRGWLNVTGSPSKVTFATSDSYRIEVHDLETRVKRLVIEREGGLRAPTEAELERLEGWPPYPPGFGSPPSALVRAGIGAVDSLSLLAAAPHIDAEGAIWAPLHAPRETTTRPFDVFDTDGIHLGRVTLPGAGLTIHEIGADYILGVARGEFAEQYVVMYELDRGASG